MYAFSARVTYVQTLVCTFFVRHAPFIHKKCILFRSGLRVRCWHSLYAAWLVVFKNVCIISGGVAQFLNQYPELCSISDPSDLAENDLRSEICSPSFLRISLISNMKLDDLACNNASSSSSSSSTSSTNRNNANHHGHFMLTPLEKPKEDDYAIFNYDELKNSKPHLYKCRFPIQIIPYLYLGNAEISSDLNCLRKNGIKYILNVTPDLPNTFEKDENFKYMQIPVDDHWSQNLSEYFPRAFEFIGKKKIILFNLNLPCAFITVMKPFIFSKKLNNVFWRIVIYIFTLL